MKNKSILRREEYKKLSALSMDGAILDIGGSKNSGYHELIKGDHVITTANIDASYGVDIIFDAQEPWPFEAATFNGVLLINVLEHLYDYGTAVQESYRVLKPGGVVVGVVPFIFNVHGSPNDYFRYTRSTLERMFFEAGFGDVQVTGLGTGGFSVIYHALLGFIRYDWMATSFMAFFTWLDQFFARIRPDNKMSVEYMPLGYYFEAHKVS